MLNARFTFFVMIVVAFFIHTPSKSVKRADAEIVLQKALTSKCDKQKCEDKRARRNLRKKVSRNPIPSYISNCESGSSGGYNALNRSSMAGGKYQIIPSTWRSYLNYVKRRSIRLAERQKPGHAKAPSYAHLASPLLQDIVARKIWIHGGASQWSCA